MLCGFYADAPDVESDTYYEDVREAICSDSLDRLSGVPEYRANGVSLPDGEEFEKNLPSYGISLRPEEPLCAYLPVWFLTYRKDDRVAYAVMNGSTGKITADLPIDEKKYLLGSLLLAIPLFALLAFFFTMTGRMVLLLSSVVAVVSLILYTAEVSAISDKESHSGDKGFVFKGEKISPGKKKKKQEAGEKKKLPKRVKDIAVIAVFFVIYAIVGLRPSIDYITGNGRITFYTIYAIASTLVLIGTLYFTYEFAETETARKSIFLHIAGSVLAVIAAAGILVWDPVSDLWFYGGSIIAAAGVCLTFTGIIRKYNVLATRPLPTFYDRKGGNDRAK